MDGWLRSKQVELTGEVLIITGRGAQSHDGVAVIRQATLQILRSLKRSGVIRGIQEDTPGSFVVELSPLRDMLEAPRRRRTRNDAPPPPSPPAIHGIGIAAEARLRDLAVRALESLGIDDPPESLIRAEMERQFSLLLRGRPALSISDGWLVSAIERSMEEYED